MTPLIRTICIFSTCLLSQAQAADDPGKDFSVQLFLNVCVAKSADSVELASAVRKIGFAELESEAAARYLGDKQGRVWRIEGKTGVIAVSLLASGVCSIIVQAGDGDRIRAGFESWLPPATTGIAITTEDIPSPPGLSSKSYRLRGSNISETWVLTISSEEQYSLRAIMSYAAQ